jgi:hypothetical protein
MKCLIQKPKFQIPIIMLLQNKFLNIFHCFYVAIATYGCHQSGEHRIVHPFELKCDVSWNEKLLPKALLSKFLVKSGSTRVSEQDFGAILKIYFFCESDTIENIIEGVLIYYNELDPEFGSIIYSNENYPGLAIDSISSIELLAKLWFVCKIYPFNEENREALKEISTRYRLIDDEKLSLKARILSSYFLGIDFRSDVDKLGPNFEKYILLYFGKRLLKTNAYDEEIGYLSPLYHGFIDAIKSCCKLD